MAYAWPVGDIGPYTLAPETRPALCPLGTRFARPLFLADRQLTKTLGDGPS